MNLPNYITLFRIILTPFFFTALVSYHHNAEHFRWIALLIFLGGAFTDALDGLLARLTKNKTALGTFLDPFADKLLLLSGFLGLLFVSDLPYRPPLWITVTIVFRDLIILTGLITLFMVKGTAEVKPNMLGKVTTAAQMLTIATILLAWKVSLFFCYVTALLTIASGLSYIKRDFKKLMA